MKKIIFICTGNSCRSQMAHGLFREMCSEKFEVFSAGSHPSRVHPAAIKVMNEVELTFLIIHQIILKYIWIKILIS